MVCLSAIPAGQRFYLLVLGLLCCLFQGRGNAQEIKAPTTAARGNETEAADEPAIKLALSAYDRGDLLKAERLLRDLAQRDPANFTVTETLGLVYAERGDFASAIPLLEQACTLNSSSALAFANLGTAYLKEGRNQDALRTLTRAASLDPSNAQTESNLGQALTQAGRFREAAEAFQLAARTEPTSPDVLYNWALALLGQGNLRQAEEVLDRVPSKESSPPAQSLLGDIAEKLGHFEEAGKHFKRAATLDPSEQNVYMLGAELARHWNFKSAAEIFTYGISNYPKSARLQVGLGVSKYGNADYAGASSIFSHLLARDLDNALYADLLGRSCSLTALEQNTGCEKLTDFAERHSQNATAACFAAAGILRRATSPKQLDLARRLLRQAIAAEPKLAKAYFEMGVLEQQEMHWRESVAPLERAVALDPQYVEAHYRLARAYAHTGKQELAQREIASQEKYSRQKKEETDARLRDLPTFLITLQ